MAINEGRYLSYDKFFATGTDLMRTIMEKIKESTLVPILEAHEDHVFLEDVADFYRTRKFNDDKMIMTARVGGKKICISAAVLSELYGLKNEGGDVTDLGAAMEEEFWALSAKEGEEMSGTLYKTQLKDEYQRFADIISKVLDCSTGSLDGLPRRRLYTMICIHYGLDVNWAVHVFELLSEKKKKYGYGILLIKGSNQLS